LKHFKEEGKLQLKFLDLLENISALIKIAVYIEILYIFLDGNENYFYMHYLEFDKQKRKMFFLIMF